MSSFGRFSEDGREYIFHSVQAPRPMLNYLWNQYFLAAVNHLGGGDGAYSDRAAQYIHPESKARAPVIRDGNRYFYIRDEETGDYWNPGWYPAKQTVEGYRCVHGLGYSMFEGRRQGIQVSLRVFVNEEDPVEIWTVTCRNLGPKARKIKGYSFVEFDLTGYNITCDYYSNVSSECVRDRNLIVAHNTSRDRDHHWHDGFIASSETLTGFETGKKAFLGTYGSIFTPETVIKGRCSNRLAACEALVGVLENSLAIEAGGEVAFNVLIGAADSTETAVALAGKLFSKGKIEADFARLRAKKAEMVRDLVIRTPDKRLDNIINNWAKQQVQLCVQMGRGTSIDRKSTRLNSSH
jgi:cellobiose phosphorylase